MRAKMVRDRRKSSLAVESSVEVHGAEVASSLDRAFAGKLAEGEVMPNHLTTMELIRRTLEEAREKLVAANERHLAELDGDIALRRQRDESADRLGGRISRLREALSGTYGSDSAVELAGIVGRTAQEPVDLLGQAELIISRLGGEVGSPTFKGFQMNPQEVRDEFVPDYESLKTAVEDLNRRKRLTDSALIAKNDAIAHYDRVFSWAASALEALYKLAGFLELARRVKPSTRRPGRTEVLENGEPDEETETVTSAAAS